MGAITLTPALTICSICGKTVEIARLPAGWKRKEEQVFCSRCWKERYLLRAIAMPVASPLDCSWEELRPAIKAMWVATTACSNWMTTELYARDVRRRQEEAKMPPMPRQYLYPEAREQFPELPAQTVAALEQAIQRKYRARRYDTVWTHAAALPTHRYPTPFPVHNQSWQATIEDEKPIVSVRIGEKRFRLRLKTGPQFRRQYGQFRLVAKGEAVKGELAIYQPSGRLMIKMVAWLPRPKKSGNLSPEGVLSVRTVGDSLLLAVNGKDETLWRYNGDHLRRWAAEHRRQLQRWSEDQKYENRPVPSFAQRRENAAGKFRNRMNSATHEIAAQLAGYASRRHFAAVRYDDSVKDFLSEFPWFRLRQLIEEKLNEQGIEMEVVASAGAREQTPEPLAEE